MTYPAENWTLSESGNFENTDEVLLYLVWTNSIKWDYFFFISILIIPIDHVVIVVPIIKLFFQKSILTMLWLQCADFPTKTGAVLTFCRDLSVLETGNALKFLTCVYAVIAHSGCTVWVVIRVQLLFTGRNWCTVGELYLSWLEGHIYRGSCILHRDFKTASLFCQAANSGVSGLPASQLPPEDGGRPTECSVRTADPHSAAVSTLLPWEGHSQPHNHAGTDWLLFNF